MVRLLFIRHAESSQNVHQSANVDAAEMSEEDALKAMRGASADEDGDFKLTPHGESQAEALGRTWAPVLEQAARRGKVSGPSTCYLYDSLFVLGYPTTSFTSLLAL